MAMAAPVCTDTALRHPTVHRSANDGYLTCHRCGADLPDGATFCLDCGAAQARRPAGDDRERRRSRKWLVAGIAAGGLVAIVGGVLLALTLTGPDATGVGSPSDGAGSTASPGASADETPASQSPVPTTSPTPVPADVFANRAIIEVATDALNLRENPNDSARVLAELRNGERLFVIGEPREADDLLWYRVAPAGVPQCGDGCGDTVIGFVATPVADADGWLASIELDCPSSPMTADDLATLAPLEMLSCYGRSDIVVSGPLDYVDVAFDGGPIDYSPFWLASPFSPASLDLQSGMALAFRPHPESGLDEVPLRGAMLRVTGHFEDPEAASCKASVNEDWWDAVGQSPQPVALPNPASLILDCRARLVWTDSEVIGP